MSAPEIRLNKFLASCGVGSRRTCDKIIQDGLVSVNGDKVITPATRVTDDDFVKMDGKRVQQLKIETILFNKPRGLVCSKSDELDRQTIFSIIPPRFQHLNHVGRLDKESEGLLVLTNDGEIAQGLTHPSKKIEKEYIVTTDQAFENEVLSKFLKGVYTPEGKAVAKSVKRLSPRRVRIVLETGLKRQIRLMFQSVHIRVKKLVRVRIGNLEGHGIEPGKIEVLEQDRIDQLFASPSLDKRATTLISQEEKRGEERERNAPPKKWARPSSRSHDGVSASDRPRRSKPPESDSSSERPAYKKSNSRDSHDSRDSSRDSSRGSSNFSKKRSSSSRGSSGPPSSGRQFGKRSFNSSKPSGNDKRRG